MTEEQIQKLIDIGISESDIPNCYITEKGIIFTPLKDIEGSLLKTGEELYNEDFLNPPSIAPSEEEILVSNIMLENATLKQQMTEQQELTANLLLQIAELKGGNTNV